jgi:TolB-like protein/Tfp pilus assembly protein PilF
MRTRISLLAAIALLGLVGLFAYRRFSTGGANPALRRVAVLPFENQGPAEDGYFADGLTHEIRGKLTTIPGIEVIAGESSLPYKKTATTPQQVAEELGAHYLLTAVVRREKASGGEEVAHLTPQLLEVTGNTAPTSLWQNRFDETTANVFQVEADIASQVASALKVPLDATVQTQLAEHPTQNLAAYDAYLRGVATFDSAFAAAIGDQTLDPASMRSIAALCERPVSLDSTFAAAWAFLAGANVFTYFNVAPDSAVLRRAREAADRAVSLAPNTARAHLALSGALAAQGQTEKSRQEGARALELAPNDVGVLNDVTFALENQGRFEEALPFARRLVTLNPRAEYVFENNALLFAYMRRPDESLEAATQARVLAPKSLLALDREIFAQFARGDLKAARGVLAKATDFDQAALLAYVAYFGDAYWVLDEAQQQTVIAMKQSAFRDRGAWSNTRAQLFALRKDTIRMRAYADTAQAALGEELLHAPNDQDRRVIRALMLAYLGRRNEAEHQAAIAVEGSPPSADAFAAPYIRHQQIRIHLVLGETDRALTELEQLFKTPYYVTKAWLRIDPTFASLKGNPRFERLAKQ